MLISAAASFACAAVLLLAFGPGAAGPGSRLAAPETGRIADRDIVADREIRYIDEAATRLRVEAEEKLVLPVFVVDEKPAARAVERFRVFQDLIASLAERKVAGETLFLSVQSQFPGLLAKEDVLALSRSPLRAQALAHADSVLRALLDQGIVALPASGLERFNPDYFEIKRIVDGKPQTAEIPAGRLVTLKNLKDVAEADLTARRLQRPLVILAAGLIKSFATEDAFFDEEQSARKLAAARAAVEPVVRTIAKGERILRKGAIVTAADSAKLAAAKIAATRVDWGAAFGSLGLLAMAVVSGAFLMGRAISGASFRANGAFAIGAASFAYFGIALAAGRVADLAPLALALLLPSALFSMAAAVLVGQRFAVLLGLVLSMLAQVAVGLDGRLFAFCVLSSAAGAFAVRTASSRIDMVKAGAVLALAEAAIAAVLAAPGAVSASAILGSALWGAVNGFACALLALAFLPVLEQALNAPTRFRLMELSDPNAPILKRLLTVAPGTYSHSVTVAHLAESACREIGADPLLARVGAYYHDIGKIEQPEYFVENQSGYNKHDELNPRLSATVIRSHVKIGAEKARSLGLPDAVVDIISQHHGNAVIAWFYDQAKKAGADVDPDDFSYPGQPPATREAAVVMLADAVEASTRSLKKPTMSRLEDFIREIIMDKVKQGQLDRSDLTFRDLETIRDAFTRILAGHFHSRIEYPKLKEQSR